MPSKKANRWMLAEKIILMIFGAALASVGLEIFLIPNDVIDGGVVGISIMASALSGLPLGVFTFALNIPFFIIGYRQIGRTFALSTLFSVVCLSVGVSILHPIAPLTNDVLLASVFGGITVGAGVGLIIRTGGSLDGTEIIAIIFDKKTGFSVGEIVMFFNLFILGAAGFVFGWDRAMYSLIAYFIAFKVIDVVVDGIDESKEVLIISEKHTDIADAITARLGRGVAMLPCQDAQTCAATFVIHVVVSRLEITKLKSIVHGFDENALVTIGSVEVAGKRYKKRAIH